MSDSNDGQRVGMYLTAHELCTLRFGVGFRSRVIDWIIRNQEQRILIFSINHSFVYQPAKTEINTALLIDIFESLSIN